MKFRSYEPRTIYFPVLCESTTTVKKKVNDILCIWKVYGKYVNCRQIQYDSGK